MSTNKNSVIPYINADIQLNNISFIKYEYADGMVVYVSTENSSIINRYKIFSHRQYSIRVGTYTPHDIESGIYIIHNSDYLEWFKDECCGVYTELDPDIQHYSIVTNNVVIDLLDSNPLIITQIDDRTLHEE